jgi:hypothetical protein
MTNTDERYSAAWKQFLTARQQMLDAYDRAQVHAAAQAVHVHHGVVGEAAVRDWLSDFLPKRFGVCAGYLRSQGLPHAHQSRHFDVIIYDQLEAPTLWIEENKDKAPAGRARIVPAEYVLAVIEVKSGFSTSTMRSAIEKLSELAPLMEGVDAPDERYPRFLPPNASLHTLFFEHRAVDQRSAEPPNLLRDARFTRPMYGAVILRSDSRHPDDTGIAKVQWGRDPMTPFGDLTTGACMTASEEVEWIEKIEDASKVEKMNLSAFLMWSDVQFGQFAFDLLALLQGGFQPGRSSSFHGIQMPETK